MHAHLFVSDHPYWTQTDATGRWALVGVPSGEYEIAYWLPPWRLATVERDPESGAAARWIMADALTRIGHIAVTTSTVTVPDVTLKE